MSLILATVFFGIFWSKYKSRFRWHEFQLSFVPGLLLAFLLLLQTIGLEFTTATKSAFLTSLYAVMTPLLIVTFGVINFHKSLWLWILISMIGVGFMVDFELDGFNQGDVLTIIGALMAALHFVIIGRIANKITYPFIFNFYQCLWAALTAVICLCIWQKPMIIGAVSDQALLGLGSLALFSTFIAFAIQLRAQKNLSETHASLLCLLEAPVSLIFAVTLLSEEPSLFQYIGCALIFTSAFLATLFETYANRKVVS